MGIPIIPKSHFNMILNEFFGSYLPAPGVNGDIFANVPSAITMTSAVLGGRIEGGYDIPILGVGVCWNTTGVMDVLGATYLRMGYGKTFFNDNVTGLNPGTHYYFQAFYEYDGGINFSSQGQFDTVSSVTIPLVATNGITDITLTTATGGGNVTNQGSSAVTARGIVIALTANPTVDSYFKKTSDGTGIGTFVSYLTGLAKDTTYYAKAYATSSVGTGYGAYVAFTTGSQIPPSITTNLVTGIGNTVAVSGGHIYADGGAAIVEKGISWNLTGSPSPAAPDSFTNEGGTMADFVSNMSGLTQGTRYYVRAYARNAYNNGSFILYRIGFGQDEVFTTTSPSLIAATLSSSLVSQTSTTMTINWTVTLSQVAPSAVSFPINATNSTNTGTSPISVDIATGQQAGSTSVTYNKQTNSFVASASFGTVPSGYSGGNSTSYTISALVQLSIVGTSNIDYASLTTVFQPTIPSNVQIGDLIIVYVILSTNSIINDPAGVSTLGKNQGIVNYNSYAVYSKIAESTDAGSTLSININISSYGTTGVIVFRGASTAQSAIYEYANSNQLAYRSLSLGVDGAADIVVTNTNFSGIATPVSFSSGWTQLDGLHVGKYYMGIYSKNTLGSPWDDFILTYDIIGYINGLRIIIKP